MSDNKMKTYSVAVIGGACAGSEIAASLRERGMEVVVFEQNPLPYGKIEDGLPRWHLKLQNKEMASIDDKLSREGIHYVPNCKLGEDVTLTQLREDWGFPPIVMATGAWRDRPLKVDGADEVTDDSLVYQNPFVYWFNHYHESNYGGKTYRVDQEPIVIGGGLASIDVAKICMFQLVLEAARERGVTLELLDMEHKGIFKTLDKAGLNYDDLNIKPARLFYRKRVIDMPLVPLDDDPTETQLEKAVKVREKLIRNATTKYGFEVHPLRAPLEILVEEGSVTGIRFQVNEFRDGRFVANGETETVACTQVISSIGSIPECLSGVPMIGELYDTNNPFTGELNQHPGVYLVGNAITGRGNIKDSLRNAKRLGNLVETGISEGELDYSAVFRQRAEMARDHVARLHEYLKGMPPTDDATRDRIRERTRELQAAHGYAGDYAAWRDQILTSR